ncbi:Putative nudix hydrolase 2 [Toxocara canis]|uniref:Putative nudix hydrolase 2 n=1 Tax=Toxocara canis TaxID=6265 RepID=A0A0B2VEZ5_TOXCA|nr:Putative nudix hydrolase 2 [Toxocara canis]
MSPPCYRLPLCRPLCKTRTVYEGRWISMRENEYGKGISNSIQSYESVHRNSRAKGNDVDAAYIIAKLFIGSKQYFILIKEYRIPVAQFCLAFPHGMVNEGETTADAGVRELLEETGLNVNKVLSCSEGSQLLVPTFSDVSVQFVTAEVSESDLDNIATKQKLDDGEFIEHALHFIRVVPMRISFCGQCVTIAYEMMGSDLDNIATKQKLDDGEFIEVVIVECRSLLQFVQQASETMNVEAVLYSFAIGYAMSH